MSTTLSIATHAVTPAVRLSQKTLVAVLLSIGYAFFVVYFPWETISREGFTDFDRYVEYFNYFNIHNVSAIDVYQLSTLREYFTSEVLWYELVLWLTGLTGEAAIALHIISFFILFVWSLFLLRRASYGVALLFLFNPTAIDVAVSGIRNGLAWSLVIIGLCTKSKALKAALFLTGMFIHSSTLVLVVLYCFTELASQAIKWSRVIKWKTLLIGGLGVGIFVGLALTVGNETVLRALGDRRVGRDYVVGGGSFLQASIWAILLFFQCTSTRDYVRQNIFVIAVLAWYQTMNPFIPWSYRIWSSFLPVVANSALKLPGPKRQMFLYLYSGYLVLQYLYWTKLFYYWYPA